MKRSKRKRLKDPRLQGQYSDSTDVAGNIGFMWGIIIVRNDAPIIIKLVNSIQALPHLNYRVRLQVFSSDPRNER